MKIRGRERSGDDSRKDEKLSGKKVSEREEGMRSEVKEKKNGEE